MFRKFVPAPRRKPIYLYIALGVVASAVAGFIWQGQQSPTVPFGWCCTQPGVDCVQKDSPRACKNSAGMIFDQAQAVCNTTCRRFGDGN